MALTRKLLEGMGIDDKQVESIIEAHVETVNGLKADRDKYKEQASKVADLQKQLEEAKTANANGSDWEKKYNDEHKAFEDYKTQIDNEKAQAEKAQAYRSMLMTAGIDPKRIDTIMKVTDLTDIEYEDGKFKDGDKLKEDAKSEWADFVIKRSTQGSNPATPPKNDDVEGADPDVARRMQERYERKFGKVEKE